LSASGGATTRLTSEVASVIGSFHVAVIQPNGIGALKPCHACYKMGLKSFQGKGIVIAHQAIRVHLPIGLLTCLRERLDEILSVHTVEILLSPRLPRLITWFMESGIQRAAFVVWRLYMRPQYTLSR